MADSGCPTLSGGWVSKEIDTTETDARLVERTREGDPRAFEALVKRYLRAAYAVALASLGSPQDAEDASQDAFIIALERLDQCRDPAKFGAWFLQIVRNRCHNLRRASRRRQALPLEAADQLSGREHPDRDAERSQLRSRLLDGMRSLSEVQREVLLLHDLEGWRHREIAEALSLPEGTVRYHLSNARRTLRELFGAGLREEG